MLCNLENSKAADRLPEAAACIAEVAQKLTKQKTPSQNTSLKSLPISAAPG